MQKQLIGTAIVLNLISSKRDRPYSRGDILAIIPLCRIPIFNSALPSLKLAMGVRLSNLYPYHLAPMGPRFSNIVIPRLTYDRSLLIM